jgi:hypothetical protein
MSQVDELREAFESEVGLSGDGYARGILTALIEAARQEGREEGAASRRALIEFVRSIAEYDEYRDDDESPNAILGRIEARARGLLNPIESSEPSKGGDK